MNAFNELIRVIESTRYSTTISGLMKDAGDELVWIEGYYMNEDDSAKEKCFNSILEALIIKLIENELQSQYPKNVSYLKFRKDLAWDGYVTQLFHQYCIGKTKVHFNLDRFEYYGFNEFTRPPIVSILSERI